MKEGAEVTETEALAKLFAWVDEHNGSLRIYCYGEEWEVNCAKQLHMSHQVCIRNKDRATCLIRAAENL